MGRPARNHGGTGGHGCHPSPGERPNFNQHVISDKTLQKMVKNAKQEPGRSTKLEVFKYLPKHDENPKRVHSENPSNVVSHMGPRRISSDRPVDSASIKVPKKVENDSQIETLSVKEPNGGHCDSPGIKEPSHKGDQYDYPSNKKPKGGPCDTPRSKEPKGGQCDTPNNKENDKGHYDIPFTKEPMLGDCGTQIGSGMLTERVDSEESGDSVSIKKLQTAQRNSLSDSLSIKESQGGQCSSVNIKALKSDSRERPYDSINKPRLVHSDRQHDSFKVPKLAQIPSGPSSQVQSKEQSTVIYEQQSIPPKGMQSFNKGVPPFSEQVNIYTSC